MKRLSRARRCVALMLATFSLLAIRPCLAESECQITLSQPALNLHVLREEEAVKKSQGWNVMQEQEVNVSVYCPEPRKIAVFFGGNAGQQNRFKFGSQSGISMKVAQLSLDGQHYSVAKTLHQGSFLAEGRAAEEQLVSNHEGIIAMSGNTLMRGQQMNFTLTVTPILKEREFQVSDRTTLMSDISLEVVDE